MKLALSLALFVLSPIATAQEPDSRPTWAGYWQSTKNDQDLLHHEPGRLARRTPEKFEAFLTRHETDRVVLNAWGVELVWPLAVEGDELRLTGSGKSGEAVVYRRLDAPPRSRSRFLVHHATARHVLVLGNYARTSRPVA